MSDASDRPYWETKRLDQMDQAEWESLCDGCALCCLQKLQDEDTEEVFFTEHACELLDIENSRCIDYAHRSERVKECLVLSPDTPGVFAWLPASCAYRTLHEGRPLAQWHPLITGNPDSVHEAGISARAFARHANPNETPELLLVLS